MSSRAKRKSSAGVQAALEAVKSNRKKSTTKKSQEAFLASQAPAPEVSSSHAPAAVAQIEERCPVCGDSYDICSECHSCRRKMHHFCSHDVCRSQ
jgi:hypothetical protein